MNGYLEIVIGPMFSGKTKSLIAIYNSLYKTENVIAINHKIDNRYSENMISSHVSTPFHNHGFRMPEILTYII